MKAIPLLFLSDSPNLPTGLARITKDLAVHASTLPEFRVGTLGRGGCGSRQLPFAQYNFSPHEQWGEQVIEQVWEDFAGSERGIIWTIWDLSRLHWFARPAMGGQLQQFLESERFAKWGYFPIDSYGVDQRLTGMSIDTLAGFHRRLAYTAWASEILGRSIKGEPNWIPHGYNENVFRPQEKTAGRGILGVDEDDLLVGCVMTNQARKDWGLAFGAIAELKVTYPNVKFWVHVDVLERAWNIRALVADFGLSKNVLVTLTGQFSSDQLSYLYSACDVTMLPSLGEGFGYPIVESLACGVPVVHGDYGGGTELIPMESWIVHAIGTRLETPWNCVRPVYHPKDYAAVLKTVLEEYQYDAVKDLCAGAVEYLKWRNLWPTWKRWIMEGIGQ